MSVPTPRAVPRVPVALLAAIGVLWLAAIGTGMKIVLDYASAAGAPAHAPERWPASSTLARAPGQPVLVMTFHPHCPCSRASVAELERLLTRCRGRLTAYVLFVQLPGFREEWVKTDLWRTAAGIPGVHPLIDVDGVESHRFGAATSGQALLYDAEGQLEFRGGITAGRGHAGDNAGEDAVVALVTHHGSGATETPVYGCALDRPETRATKGAEACPK